MHSLYVRVSLLLFIYLVRSDKVVLSYDFVGCNYFNLSFSLIFVTLLFFVFLQGNLFDFLLK